MFRLSFFFLQVKYTNREHFIKRGNRNEKESRKKRAQTSDVSERSSASEALRPNKPL